MKRLIFLFTLVSIVLFNQAQDSKIVEFTDLDLATALVGMKQELVEDIIKKYDVAYWITNNKEGKLQLYISYNQSVRAWKLDIGNIVRTTGGKDIVVAKYVVKEVFVRYRHSNLNDLKAFFAYKKPEDEKYRIFEKQMGSDISHLRITQN